MFEKVLLNSGVILEKKFVDDNNNLIKKFITIENFDDNTYSVVLTVEDTLNRNVFNSNIPLTKKDEVYLFLKACLTEGFYIKELIRDTNFNFREFYIAVLNETKLAKCNEFQIPQQRLSDYYINSDCASIVILETVIKQNKPLIIRNNHTKSKIYFSEYQFVLEDLDYHYFYTVYTLHKLIYTLNLIIFDFEPF